MRRLIPGAAVAPGWSVEIRRGCPGPIVTRRARSLASRMTSPSEARTLMDVELETTNGAPPDTPRVAGAGISATSTAATIRAVARYLLEQHLVDGRPDRVTGHLAEVGHRRDDAQVHVLLAAGIHDLDRPLLPAVSGRLAPAKESPDL